MEKNDILGRACKFLRNDFEPFGCIEPETGEKTCASGCRHYFRLADPNGDIRSWGVCTNTRSHRVGLLTNEHQGCTAFEV